MRRAYDLAGLFSQVYIKIVIVVIVSSCKFMKDELVGAREFWEFALQDELVKKKRVCI